MKRLGVSPETKEEGLREFSRRGWVLVDATYEPVDNLSPSKRKEAILRNYSHLRDDLSKLLPNRSTPAILIKATLCKLLEPRLTADGFNVLNRGRLIYFPAFGKAGDFHRQFEAASSGVASVQMTLEEEVTENPMQKTPNDREET
jgi:hypothetical protein